MFHLLQISQCEDYLYWMLQILVASLEIDVKWRKPQMIPTFSVLRMDFYVKVFGGLVISVKGVSSDVTGYGPVL